MKLDPEEQKRGTIWFFTAGFAGLCIIVFLAAMDVKLTYSDSEIKHATMLNELRTAQSSLVTGSADRRISSTK